MRVLEQEQNCPLAGQGLELMQQRFEQLFALALRAEVEIGGTVRQRQQLGDQLDLVRIARGRRNQRIELGAAVFRAVFTGEGGGALQLHNEWVKRAVLLMRRAE